MQRIRVDQHALKIPLTQQLLKDRALIVLPRGVAGLGECNAHACGVQRHLSNERVTATVGGFDRTAQGVAVTHQLIKIGCTTWDLSNRPVTDGAADGGDVYVQEEIAKG